LSQKSSARVFCFPLCAVAIVDAPARFATRRIASASRAFFSVFFQSTAVAVAVLYSTYFKLVERVTFVYVESVAFQAEAQPRCFSHRAS
jgi:hypothetical protein